MGILISLIASLSTLSVNIIFLSYFPLVKLSASPKPVACPFKYPIRNASSVSALGLPVRHRLYASSMLAKISCCAGVKSDLFFSMFTILTTVAFGQYRDYRQNPLFIFCKSKYSPLTPLAIFVCLKLLVFIYDCLS